MSEQLTELKAQRASTKGCITRIRNLIDSKAGSLSYTEFECRLGILESYFKQLLSYQSSIEKLVPEDANEEKIRGEFEDLYCATKSKILTLMSGHRNSSSFQEHSFMANAASLNNLPKLKLPQFSGKYSEFPNLIGSFSKLVDKNDTLSQIEKFNHLLSCLSGAALRTVKAFEVTEDNYSKALSHLEARYDNKYLIFQEHIVDLFNMPKIKKNSASQLRYLVDGTNAHLSALLTLGSYEDITNALIIYLVNAKLDPDSQCKWEESMERSKLPTWKECADILNKRCQFLEARDTKFQQKIESSSSPKLFDLLRGRKFNSNSTSLTASNSACLFCKEYGHAIYKCTKFLELPVLIRFEQIKRRALCVNCLSKGHSVKRCPSQKCRVCLMPHHTLLHRYATAASSSNETSDHPNHKVEPRQQSSSVDHSYLTSSLLSKDQAKCQVFLAAAVVEIKDNIGRYHLARALLDSASQLNFISENLAQSLKLKRSKSELNISGIGDTSSKVRWSTEAVIKSRFCGFETNLSLYVLPHITGLQPERKVTIDNWNIPSNIPLADPQFFKPQRVDLLIGADIIFQLLCVGQIKLSDNLPTLQKTVFGWVVSGKYSNSTSLPSILSCHISSDKEEAEAIVSEDKSLNELVERFWKEEDIERTSTKLSGEQMECEAVFPDMSRRLPDGRFLLKLPFRESPLQQLGNSFEVARRRFGYLERKLSKDPDLKAKYSQFLREYLSAGHMEEISMKDVPQSHYFMPHRCVLRPESSTTKLRVVFDASCRTTSNKSLNDLLMVGPNVQDDLFSIISRFRCHKFALTADISAMYRQVLVYPEDRNYQLILWRDNPDEEIQIFRLKTVTYGTASAPFLATRCLRQLAEEYSTKLPRASRIVEQDFYMDDLLTGADTREELYDIRQEVDIILKSAQFHLRKWYPNDRQLLSEIPEQERETPLKLNESDVVKALGMIWEPTADQFRFQYKPPVVVSSKITKRSILSNTARLFDPLGLINPVVVRAKIFLQELWLLKLNWDESLPQDLQHRWCQFMEQLEKLNTIKIPRSVLSVERVSNLTLHGFADASIRAYGCCIYIQCTDDAGNISVNLLAAKSKVAPMRTTRSLPCLELCAALLLSRLVAKVRNNFPSLINEEYLWADSEIVLDWLASHASNWKTYVSNRVSEIQGLTERSIWRHVNSKANPADMISRGVETGELSKSMWFSGPDFLGLSKDYWPPLKERHSSMDSLPERRKMKSILVCNVTDSFLDTLYSVSDFTKNFRRFAYILRFYRNLVARRNKNVVEPGELLASEIDEAFMRIIWAIQQHEFAEEMRALEYGHEVSNKSAIKRLAPFLDETTNVKLLRVGGRLKHAELTADRRFPILLPRNNFFVRSYVKYLHLKNYHAGAQALVSIIEQKFWLARGYARKIVRNCIHCFRYRPRLAQQIMGDLPRSRVNISLPFTHSGVDFCGPIMTTYRIRGKVPYKSYVALFVCFVIRAAHIEVVSDLTSEAFIAALKRFIGRRNLCRHLYCNNATNFVGARKRLEEFKNSFLQEQTQRDIRSWCSNNSIEFHHIPPRSPHFGGIWEAAVKSAKAHLYRTLQNSMLTFEELTTVMVQIEGVLNLKFGSADRGVMGLTPLSADPNDFQALTPAHFLNQALLDTFPEPTFLAALVQRISEPIARKVQVAVKIFQRSDRSNGTDSSR